MTASRKSDRSFIGAFLHGFSHISRTPQRMGNRSGFPVDAVLLGPANFELRVTIYWISLETIVNSIQFFFETTPPRILGHQNALTVPQFCRAEHHGGRPFLMTLCGFEKAPRVAIGEIFGWIRFQPRDGHKCNRLFLDSSIEDILFIALLELFRITRTTLHCPFHESSLSIRH